MSRSAIPSFHRPGRWHERRRSAALVASFAVATATILTPMASAPAAAADVGQGFTVTSTDLSFILKQIRIAETHVANTTAATGPCGALVGDGPHQIPSPLISAGLRTVDGSCNNLNPGNARIGAADQVFPRLTKSEFHDAQGVGAGFFGPGSPAVPSSSYAQKKGDVFDTEPRIISNLVVDQTSTNPAAIAAAGFPVRTQGNPGVQPCTVDPDPLATPPVAAAPANCTPSFQTLFIPNVTTDVGLSPPYNSMFTLFGQFFDHGVDQTVKGGGTVFVPLKSDDPLIAGPDHKLGTADDLPASQRFMVLTRGKNQPGPDGIIGDDPATANVDESADDVQNALNTDSPWVDQSQTYTSHASHQAFLREYVASPDGPIATGKLLGGTLPAGAPATQDTGMATWTTTKAQAANLLGLRLVDKDVLNVPMLAVDPYGQFIPGPARGLPQYVTSTGLVEGNLANPVPVPANVRYFETPFLTDIAHNADPSPQDTDHNPATPPVAPTPDTDNVASADFASQPPGTYDDEMLNAHFIAGDGRVNENIGLTAIHQVFHSEHDRLVGDIESTLNAVGNEALKNAYHNVTAGGAVVDANAWNYGDRLFQAARFVTEMEYQHLVFEEFARKVQPAINPFEPFAFTQPDLNPAVRAEFAHAVYRFGHSMLTETIERKNPDGTHNDISLLQGFLNPPSYTDNGAGGKLSPADAAGSIIMGMSDQVGNELDEFVTDTLRNNLLGLPLDLPTVNMTRARSEGIPPLNVVRRQIFNATNDGQLKPYTSWVDFGENIRHPESLVNFVAAYGQHPTILTNVGPDGVLVDDPGTLAVDEAADNGPATLKSRREAARRLVNPVLGEPNVPADAAEFMNSVGAWANTGTRSITGLDNVDLWVGGLAENTNPFGGLLGTTFNYVFENQLTDLQNGDRLYYLARTPGMNLRTQLEGNSFAELMMRNTTIHTIKADAFATADCKFELSNLAGTPAGFAATGNTVTDDAASECDESALLIRQPDGTIQYRAVNSVDPPGINGQSVYNGTGAVDRIRGGNDNDTFWGGVGNDVIEGGAGADVALGGEDSDIITDLGGDDVPKGGPGNDAIDAGPGLDILMGGTGKDFTNGGANANETFGGADDDFIYLGQSLDAAFGDSGDDWEEGGDQPDLMQGDSGNLFFLDDSQAPGSDILVGQGGDDDYDMEGGDDIGVGGSGIEKVAGASGYDWEIGQGETLAQDMDLALPIPPLGILQVGVRDKFNEVEALSGWKFDDKLRGDDAVPAQVGGAGFIGCDALDQDSLDRIPGLDPLVPPLNTPLASVVAQSASQDCPVLSGANVWGDGNVLLGGAGSDLIEGRGGDDIIDGDRYLGVRLSVRTNANDPATEIGSASIEGPGQSAMTSQYLRDSTGALTGPTLQEAVFAGTVNPGNIVAVREVLDGGVGGTDIALFTGARANFTVTTSAAGVTTVTDNQGTEGVDTLRNIETLRFCTANDPVTGSCTAFTDETVSLPLAVASTSPVNGATTAPVGGDLTATFNRAVTSPNLAAAAVLRNQAGTAVARAVSLDATGRTVTVNPNANLTPNATYTLTLLGGTGVNAFRDLAGNRLPQSFILTFRTAGDTTAPTVTSSTPANNATGVLRGANTVVNFSEAVTGVSATSVVLTTGTTVVPTLATLNAAGTRLVVDPNGSLARNTLYTVTLTGGASGIRDTVGNPLATTTITFRTIP